MRKRINFLLLFAALLLPMVTRAQVTCPTGDAVTVSNADTSTTTSSYIPGYSLYNYSYTEVIIPAEQLDGIGSILALQFNPTTTTGGTQFDNCEIYLANTSAEDLSTGFIQDANEFELVWSGDMNYSTTGWQTIVFDDAFQWDGASNVVIAVRRNNGSWSGTPSFAAFTAEAQLARYIYQDSGPYTIGSISATASTATTTVAWYKLIGCEGTGSSICRKPRNIVVSDLASDGATLTWNGHEDHSGYTLMYHTADFDPDTTEDAITVTSSDTTYTFSGLDASTTYYVKIKADCSDGGESGWTSAATFHTLCEDGGCDLVIDMADSYGDGWNGNGITVTVGGLEVATATIASGSSDTYTYNMCGTDNVVLTWVSGSYASETSFDVTVGGTVLISDASGSDYSAGQTILNITGCPACPAPSDIVVSNITSDGADISWTANGNETQWVIKIGNNDWETANDTVYTASGLENNTVYNVIVRALCDDGDSSYAAYGSFRTACGGSTTMPYSTNFDNDNDGEAPACWLAVQTGTSGSGTFPSVYYYSSNSYSSPKYFEFESNSGETEMVALPVMDNISSLALSFYASVMNTNFVLEVGVLEGSDFVVVDTVNLMAGSGGNWHNSYYPYTVYFSNYSGSGDRIAMRVTATGSYTLMMDDFTVEEFYGCYPVSDIVARNIDSTEITLAWADELNGGVAYNIYYWTDGGDTLVETANDTTITLTNLSANTLYNIAVRANCVDGEAPAVNASFRTACGITAIPYSEGFEGLTTGAAPACWTVLGGNPRVMTSVPHSGSQHLYFSGSYTNAIALPPMNMPTNELQVRFWTRPESYTSSSCGTFSVGYMTDLTVDSSFVQLSNWAYNEFSAYEEKEVPMIGAPDDAYIVLRHNANSSYYYWYVDDLVVEPIPSCARPTSVSVSNVTSTDADINIVGVDGAAYRILWSDGTTTDSADVTGDTYSLSGLTGSTNYVVSVSTICDDGSLTTPVSTTFRTACDATALPWEENFDNITSINDLSCWERYSGLYIDSTNTGLNLTNTTSGWTRYTTGMGGSSHIKLNIYGTTAKYWIVTPSMAITESAELSFDYSLTAYASTGAASTNCPDDRFVVLITADNGATWTPLAKWGSDSTRDDYAYTAITNSVQSIAFPITGYDGQTIRIAFYGESTVSNGDNDLHIDNIMITSSTCPRPTSVAAVATSATEIDVTISGDDAANYRVYWTDGTTTDSATVTGLTYTITGLTGATLYNISVVTICDDGSITMPATTSARTECANGGCDIQIVMDDSFGDGWNGNAIIGYVGGVETFQATMTSGYTGTFTYSMCENDNVVLIWHSGSFASETSFEITLGGNPLVSADGDDYSNNDTVAAFVGCPACSAPQGITISNITMTSAEVNIIDNSGNSGYRLWYSNGITTDSVDLTTTTYTLTGLTSSTSYTVMVSAICSDGSLSFATQTNFATACDIISEFPYLQGFESQTAPAACWKLAYGSSDVTSNPMLHYTLSSAREGSRVFRFSSYSSSSDDIYDQYLISPEFSSTDSLYLSFYYMKSSSYGDDPFKVGYSTTDDSLASFTWGTEYMADDELVWYTFYQAFPPNTKYLAIHYYGDYEYYLYIDSLVVSSEGGISCSAPTIGNVTVGNDNVTVAFSANGTVEAAIVEGNTFNATSGTVVTGNTHTFTGLNAATTYTFGLRTLCEDGITSSWVTRTVTTDSAACFVPTNVTVSATTFDGATITWTAGGEETAWEVRVYNTTFDQTYNANANTLTVSGLNEGTFNVTVRALCSATNSSEWSEPIQFTTESCLAPTGVTVSGVTTSGATVSWTPAASSNGNYTMEYGISGFSRGQGTTVDVTGTTYTITGLDADVEYDVYVASYCGENIVSPWTPVQSFTTQADGGTYTITVRSNNEAWGTVTGGGTYPAGTEVTLTATATSAGEFVEWQDGVTEAIRTITVTADATYIATFREKVGIEDVDGNAIMLYPNPASSNVTISGMEMQSQVMIVDMNGREVYRATATDGSVKIDVSGMSKGAYFVRITGEKSNAIRKLVVK